MNGHWECLNELSNETLKLLQDLLGEKLRLLNVQLYEIVIGVSEETDGTLEHFQGPVYGIIKCLHNLVYGIHVHVYEFL